MCSFTACKIIFLTIVVSYMLLCKICVISIISSKNPKKHAIHYLVITWCTLHTGHFRERQERARMSRGRSKSDMHDCNAEHPINQPPSSATNLSTYYEQTTLKTGVYGWNVAGEFQRKISDGMTTLHGLDTHDKKKTKIYKEPRFCFSQIPECWVGLYKSKGSMDME